MIRRLVPTVKVSSASAPVETDPVVAAEAARLHHVRDRSPGLRRRATGKTARFGKRFVPLFAIFDAKGRRVHDDETLARVRALAIPPAWTDVWICPRPDGHLQATGRDARGRKQYRYHRRWREQRDDNKYARMIQFAGLLPALRRRVAADMGLSGLPRRKVLATVIKLLETTFIRVGNEEYARSNRSFGLTTLEDRHVDFRRGVARFHFRGKSGVFHDIAVEDPVLARIVRQCRDIPGQELFQYRNGEGNAETIDSADVNDYIHEQMGDGFTAKDFRTWAGTVLAAVALNALAVEANHPPGQPRMGGTSISTTRLGPSGAKHLRRVNAKQVARASAKGVARAVQQVAARLRNTPAVCRRCYIHPGVIGAYVEGTLTLPVDDDDRLPKGQKRSRSAAGGPTALRPEERAVLALLRRQGEGEKHPEHRAFALSVALRRSLQVRRTAAAA
jgi:DNA topoisomerase I